MNYLITLILFVGMVWWATKYIPKDPRFKVAVWIGAVLLVALFFPKIVILMEGLNDILAKMIPLDKK